jgi:hypothetical protein
MKFTLFELKSMESVLVKLSKYSMLEVKVAFRLGKFIKEVASELQLLEDTRVKLVNKYGEKNSADQIVVAQDKLEAFQKDYKELVDTESIIEFEPIDIECLASVRLTPEELGTIEKLIKT